MFSGGFRAKKKSPVVSKHGRKRTKAEVPQEGLNESTMHRRVSSRIQAKQKSEELLVHRRLQLLDNPDDRKTLDNPNPDNGKKIGTSRKRVPKDENVSKRKRARKDENVENVGKKDENVGKPKRTRKDENVDKPKRTRMDENVGKQKRAHKAASMVKEKLVGKRQRANGVSKSDESTKVRGKLKSVNSGKKVHSEHGKNQRVYGEKNQRVNGVSKSNGSIKIKGKLKIVGLEEKVNSEKGKKQRVNGASKSSTKAKGKSKIVGLKKMVDSENGKKQRVNGTSKSSTKAKGKSKIVGLEETFDSENGKKQKKQRVNGALKSLTKEKGKSKIMGLKKKVDSENVKKQRVNGKGKNSTKLKGKSKIVGLEIKVGSENGDTSLNGKKQRVSRVSKNESKVKGKSKIVDLEKKVDSENGGTSLVEKSDSLKVKETLRLFNKHYLHFVQGEEKCSELSGKSPKSKRKALPEDIETTSKRPDLKAITKMMENNEILFPEKRIGDIPGIKVGHQFYSRAEMVALGFHGHWLNGIDYMGQSYRKLLQYHHYTFPLAVSIVLSGMYEDDLDNAEDVVYTGQGGHNLNGDKRQIQDQVLMRGNLALKNCIEQCVPVRVTRGHKLSSSYCGKVYTYDGLYKVISYWAEKGISGFTVYKYRLRRIEGQPTLTTNQVYFTNGRVPQSTAEIRGLVCEDITGGQEDVPIPATNMVDDPPVAPTGFTYSKSIKLSKNVMLPANATGCNCKGVCIDPKSCACALLNGSDFPYVSRNGGRLIEAKDVVFECGPQCSCGPECVNRTSQKGLGYRLEVFRTAKKGWAVRSWDFIPSGAPVCEYTGILRKTEDLDSVSENNYIFEIDCLQTMKGLGGRERRVVDGALPSINLLDKYDDHNSESVPEFCIDAGSTGNIARFINHSCDPNLFVQCVLSSHRDLKLARVMLVAADNIPPLQELSYDYGYAIDSVLGPDGKIKQMACYCGTAGCKKRLF